MARSSIQQHYRQVPVTPPRKPHATVQPSPESRVVPESPLALQNDPDGSECPSFCDLSPGPGRLTLICRIIAIQQRTTHSASAESLRSNGHWRLCVKDDTGAITILLYYKTWQYVPILGSLVRLRVPHLSFGNTKVPVFNSTSLFASIFPERDSSCSFEVIKNPDLCRQPLEFQANQFIDRLTTLEAFSNGDHELMRVVILVCVKSIGPRVERMVKNKSEEERKASVSEVRVFDQTGEAVISFWDALAFSPMSWTPNGTTLLIYSASYDPARNRVLIRDNTYIDVDPCHDEAERLIKWVSSKTQSDSQSNIEPPSSTFNTEEALSGQRRILFTIAMFDQWVRGTPSETPVMGFFSLIVLELNICKLRAQHKICHAQCCGIPIFANIPEAPCKQCGQSVKLRLNPSLVGTLLDETGNIACGQLLWSDKAWEELFGQHPRDLVKKDSKSLKSLEARMLHMRLTFLMGWESSLKKLSVLSVAG